MKERCAGMAVVLALLVAFGIGMAQQDIHGVLDPKTLGVTIDSVYMVPPDQVFPTTGWAAQGTTLDSFDFPDIPSWPTTLTIYAVIGTFQSTTTIVNPLHQKWYPLNYMGSRVPFVLFWGAGDPAVEEPRTAVEPPQLLNVSPSVVTGQMTVRLQPMGPGRPAVDIHDAVGNVVRTLECTAGADGRATATWNREDGFGCLVPEGVYFCRYAASGAIAVRKVLVTY